MTAWHLRAVRLPEGDVVEDLWLTGDGWSDRPIPDAERLPGAFALPGLVDAHSHVSFGDDGDGPVPWIVPAPSRTSDGGRATASRSSATPGATPTSC
ncbi:MAG: hypothetical protein ACRDG8_12045 [Actinomycetota bacterium]